MAHDFPQITHLPAPMKYKQNLALLLRGSLLAAMVWLAPTTARATAPEQIHYQGRITDAGTPVEGTADFKFAILGAGSTTLWSNNGTSSGGSQPTAAVTLPVENGVFSVLLGGAGMQAVPASVFDEATTSLRVWVNHGSGFQQLSPDQPLAATPYAMSAAYATNLRNNATLGGSHSVPGNASLQIQLGGSRGLLIAPTSPVTPPNIILGSSLNTISGGVVGATISGGGAQDLASWRNRVEADFGTVGGGQSNAATGQHATVSGGDGNVASGFRSTISGGINNSASLPNATVGGGLGNQAAGENSWIGGGENNNASDSHAAIGGGRNNSATAELATVGGGRANIASGTHSAIAGGQNNLASGTHSTIAGGLDNTGGNEYATVAGGRGNVSSGGHSTIGGGRDNIASNLYTNIAGGQTNVAEAAHASIGGGHNNEASGPRSTVSGGVGNIASKECATVAGGNTNTASGTASMIPGGASNLAGGDFSLAAGRRAKVQPSHHGAFVWADSSNADFSSTAADQFLIRAGGGVGINTGSPASGAALHVMGHTVIGGAAQDHRLAVGTDTPLDPLHVVANAAQSPFRIMIDNNDEESTVIRGYANQGVSIGNGYDGPSDVANNGLRVEGDVRFDSDLRVFGTAFNTGGGSWTSFSDQRLKENIAPLGAGALNRLLSLQPTTFTFSPRAIDEGLGAPGPQTGFIAQEVADVFPEWVGESSDGWLHITEKGTTALLVQALRELREENDRHLASQQEQIDAQAAEISSLREEMAEARALIEKLASQVEPSPQAVAARADDNR